MKNIVVLTGAGISAESGISTFRDSNGLWENHDIMEVASIDGWHRNPALVLEFYNQRRRQLKNVMPNAAHEYLAKLEEKYHVNIITQNVDNLHEKAGSTQVIHLHGELTKACSEKNKSLAVDWWDDIVLGDLAEDGAQLRPYIVWFGEAVPMMEKAIELVLQADLFLVIGTSLQVYPAASLLDFVPNNCPIYYIDPKADEINYSSKINTIRKTATEGVKCLNL
ncbi:MULTISPECIES: SIR2 family NAD-dependent protein deacylase [Weeksella]|uniref:NAD-dependent protein deacylase n=1 Tax=Weeksella virosa (strain ATCC 43766 / DSM 16922 / JCM 21250 / CCUG 30538 / CDC 9751 / IAM 14551 / NBRC 16016 / NCTC 11634 / CL345/78) TaxID=865938 RepID=F0NYJ6_WEEVC|nr:MULTISPECIES: NAD-dependent deacylase [Weeksella]ADX67116.1 NAD-dependent deacetylase [Weeksella virosa DSM 16922]MDK7375611.1 NAD-dependent deacylase [Weeksella virosa]MDK7676255.1 NAD-dependent deacylase [Weeksella virosa]OFM81591.1 NAD-dependent deacylase [Weeksella sp. HMSC059D05]SUP53387.1 NAD-dependent deacetylase [Weeksella virosa]